jgi:hypothetical protein
MHGGGLATPGGFSGSAKSLANLAGLVLRIGRHQLLLNVFRKSVLCNHSSVKEKDARN